MAEQLAEARASQLRCTFFNVIVAGFDPAGKLAGDRDVVCRLYLSLILLRFDLIDDAGVLLGDLLVIDRALVLEGQSLRRMTLLFSSQVGYLQET